ncbi:hypothetical protein JL722_9443 [Aureococcus anophagefferens]|nr:hypothetical protein JL722_9443 [Aureococcus anophagefferens]
MAPMRAMRQAPRAWDADFAVPAAAPAPLLAKGDAKGDGRVASVTQDLFSAYASRAASMESSIAALTGDLEATRQREADAAGERDRLDEGLRAATRDLEDERRDGRARRLVEELTSALRRSAWEDDFRGDDDEARRRRGRRYDDDDGGGSSDGSADDLASPPRTAGGAWHTPQKPSPQRRGAARYKALGARAKAALDAWRNRRDAALLEVQEGRAAIKARQAQLDVHGADDEGAGAPGPAAPRGRGGAPEHLDLVGAPAAAKDAVGLIVAAAKVEIATWRGRCADARRSCAADEARRNVLAEQAALAEHDGAEAAKKARVAAESALAASSSRADHATRGSGDGGARGAAQAEAARPRRTRARAAEAEDDLAELRATQAERQSYVDGAEALRLLRLQSADASTAAAAAAREDYRRARGAKERLDRLVDDKERAIAARDAASSTSSASTPRRARADARVAKVKDVEARQEAAALKLRDERRAHEERKAQLESWERERRAALDAEAAEHERDAAPCGGAPLTLALARRAALADATARAADHLEVCAAVREALLASAVSADTRTEALDAREARLSRAYAGEVGGLAARKAVADRVVAEAAAADRTSHDLMKALEIAAADAAASARRAAEESARRCLTGTARSSRSAPRAAEERMREDLEAWEQRRDEEERLRAEAEREPRHRVRGRARARGLRGRRRRGDGAAAKNALVLEAERAWQYAATTRRSVEAKAAAETADARRREDDDAARAGARRARADARGDGGEHAAAPRRGPREDGAGVDGRRAAEARADKVQADAAAARDAAAKMRRDAEGDAAAAAERKLKGAREVSEAVKRAAAKGKKAEAEAEKARRDAEADRDAWRAQAEATKAKNGALVRQCRARDAQVKGAEAAAAAARDRAETAERDHDAALGEAKARVEAALRDADEAARNADRSASNARLALERERHKILLGFDAVRKDLNRQREALEEEKATFVVSQAELVVRGEEAAEALKSTKRRLDGDRAALEAAASDAAYRAVHDLERSRRGAPHGLSTRPCRGAPRAAAAARGPVLRRQR